ncbi:MAG: PHP domain-containing protein [Acidobacteria bacterium]|nr:PHP domain-containing protein [Acidobacteriota bacterium]
MTRDSNTEKRWLKAEMHAHCNMDPRDHRVCRFTPEQLIQKAAGLGYEVLSFTCHDRDIWTENLAQYARSRGITLIPGMEVTVEKTRHVLVYNSGEDPRNLDTLEKIRARADERTLVVAPHPFYPGRSCLRGFLSRHPDLFHAIEYSGFMVPGVNFNRRGVRLAGRHRKPVVGFGDIHFLWQLGKTYTWIYAEPRVESILDAVKRGSVRVSATPLTWLEAAQWWSTSIWRKLFPWNAPSRSAASDKIEDGRCLGTPQQSVKP